MKILIAPDKFKGTLTAAEAAAIISRSFRRALPGARLTAKPIADGGEGFVKALAQRFTTVQAPAPLGREVTAEYGWLDDSTAVLEMSAASGLWRVAPADRAPLRASTFGTGVIIRDAHAHGAREILLGLGGSATNDGGAGMAAALGYRFLASGGIPLAPLPANFPRITTIIPPSPLNLPHIIAACDVTNPLTGPHGATRVYAPQKGATPADLPLLENALAHLADAAARDLQRDERNTPGAGAAGGLGFGLLTFCNAEIRPGFDLVAQYTRLEDAIAESDLIITGEGKIDAQTWQGKGPAGVAALAHRHGKPVIAFAGIRENASSPELPRLFDAIFTTARPGFPNEWSLRHGPRLLEETAETIATRIAKEGFWFNGTGSLRKPPQS